MRLFWLAHPYSAKLLPRRGWVEATELPPGTRDHDSDAVTIDPNRQMGGPDAAAAAAEPLNERLDRMAFQQQQQQSN